MAKLKRKAQNHRFIGYFFDELSSKYDYVYLLLLVSERLFYGSSGHGFFIPDEIDALMLHSSLQPPVELRHRLEECGQLGTEQSVLGFGESKHTKKE